MNKKKLEEKIVTKKLETWDEILLIIREMRNTLKKLNKGSK